MAPRACAGSADSRGRQHCRCARPLGDARAWGVRFENGTGASCRDQVAGSLADAILQATHHLADNPGRVGWDVERGAGDGLREHPVRPLGVHIDPIPWAALIHLEWSGVDVTVTATGTAAAVAVCRPGRTVTGSGATGTATAEDARRAWAAAPAWRGDRPRHSSSAVRAVSRTATRSCSARAVSCDTPLWRTANASMRFGPPAVPFGTT